MAKKKSASKKSVSHYGHEDASRKNIPSAEMQPVVRDEVRDPIPVSYDRAGESFPEESAARNADLDPQLVWRGKDDGPLEVQAPALYIQEKVHPKAIIDDLLRQTRTRAGVEDEGYYDADLFGDFNGLPEEAKSTDFYRHEGHWSNRMILGDALQVMSSLSEREGLRGKVQCIYLDPPYGIKFKSNFQWSTTTRDVSEADKAEEITREPEQVSAFRDTWRDGIHSYLSYLRDRLIAGKGLLKPEGSIFVQINVENVHRVRAVLDEVFGEKCFISEILVKKKGSQKGGATEAVNDFVLWYSRSPKKEGNTKIRTIFEIREDEEIFDDFDQVELEVGERLSIADLEKRDKENYRESISSFRKAYPNAKLFAKNPLKSGGTRKNQSHDFRFRGKIYEVGANKCWKHTAVETGDGFSGMARLAFADRLFATKSDLRFIRYSPQPSIRTISNWWDGLGGAKDQVYVVQTNERIVERCLQMATDPGDLVLDPTCGSGTTAFVSEKLGRRWITIDTSRVALALARARIMGARYPYFFLLDSDSGAKKQAQVLGKAPSTAQTFGKIGLGFAVQYAKNITSAEVANNSAIDVIVEEHKENLEALLRKLQKETKRDLTEWDVPVLFPEEWPDSAEETHRQFRNVFDRRQEEIDRAISSSSDLIPLYDKPYEDKSRARVAGPFTVESVAPHRMLSVDENDELVDSWDKVAEQSDAAYGGRQQDFTSVILENLRSAGVQQANKEDRIHFTSIEPVAGSYVCAVGTYTEGDDEDAPQRKAGIFIGPEFGTVRKNPELVAAAREAAEIGYDVLIACAFNYDAHSTEFEKLGGFPVLKARMNADLHMADDLKNTGKGNLFVIFGEPDIDVETLDDGQLQVRLNGVDIFKPSSGEVVSSDAKDIACWFIDTDYNEESFFVRHAYFLGQNDPYKALKTTLKSEIDEEAWSTLNRDTSRPFAKPTTGRIAVKVINHLGDEVMKVFSV